MKRLLWIATFVYTMPAIGNFKKTVDITLQDRDSPQDPIEKWEHPDGTECWYYKNDGPTWESDEYWIVWKPADADEGAKTVMEFRRDMAQKACTRLLKQYKNTGEDPISIDDSNA